MSIASDIQKLEPGALVELFVVEVPGGDTLRFHAGTNALDGDVVWQGNTYTRFPVMAEGFEKSGKGSLPRPKIKVANITGLIGALARENDDLVGARITRKRTFARYLDAVNFPGGVNPSADPLSEFPDEIWSVDRKSSENAVFVEWELAAAIDLAGVALPRRQVIQNVCPWRYRSTECGYTGGAVADLTDAATSDLSADACGKRLTSCKLRFGQYGELPFGGFPAAGLIR